MTKSKSHLDVVNASGFLFQMRVEQEIEAAQHTHAHRWAMAAREHRYIDPFTGNEGFIDLVLAGYDGERMIIECKRTQNAHWIFLVPHSNRTTYQARLLWTHRQAGASDLWGRDDFNVTPESPESSFCVIRGQGEKDAPMLERLAGVVLRSAERLAEEELGLGKHSNLSILYYPVIVTNATLLVCRFDSGQVDLKDGMLTETDAQFEEAPFVRFRKNLSTAVLPSEPADGLAAANAQYERTVFVVSAAKLSDVLANWKLTPSGVGMIPRYPWFEIREQQRG